MRKTIATFKNLWKDESGQGATEYILLLVIVVAIAFLFKDKIQTALSAKLNELGGSIGSFSGN
jgi:Flp pilus assembly pilin Flp